MADRIALPDLAIPNQVNAAGVGLINAFASDLFDFIDSGLRETKGPQWLVEMQITNVGADLNYRDPSVLLKELVHKGGTPLRAPISSLIPRASWKDFYKRLEDLLGERHLWVHNSITADAEQLKSLIVLISKISVALNLEVAQESKALLDHINPDEILIDSDSAEPDIAPSEIAAELGRFTRGDETPVGTPLAGPFISHSYTLHINGSVRDRSTDLLLSDLISDGETLGALLIARKPSGGRIRITSNGELAAYFGDSWGFLAKVNRESWFPGHLN
jgi:hypothetical protein